MNNSMIAHLWANEKQESAYGSNFYFNGTIIYSYGPHYKAGRIVKNKRGEKAYLINESGYSNSTSKHLRYIRAAIPTGSTVFSVGYNMSNSGNMLFVVSQLETIKESADRYKKARTEICYNDVWKPFKSLLAYIEFFDMETPKQLLKKNVSEWLGTEHKLASKPNKVKQEYVRELKRILQIMLNHQALGFLSTVNVIIDEICGEGTWASYLARLQKWRESQEAREAAYYERRKAEDEFYSKTLEEKIQMWKEGKVIELSVPWINKGIHDPNVLLRIRNGKVETSKGIKISKNEAERLWKRIKSFHDGAKFQHDLAKDSSGHSWAFNTYQNDILTAGCHRIAYSEMEEIAMKLGFI